jgi:hypothetical protein
LTTIYSSSISTQTTISYLKQVFVRIVKTLITVSIIAIITSYFVITIGSVESYLYCEVCASRYFYHFTRECNLSNLWCLINFSVLNFLFNFITWCVHHNVFISNKECALTWCQSINSKPCNHNGLIRSPSNSIPWSLWVPPTWRTYSLESHKAVHISLTLYAE